MEQFLDADNKWHVTLTVDIPRVIVKNKLNFRLHSIVMKDGSIVRDPSLASSNYIFGISTSFLGKKAFFFSFFDATQIEDVAEFKFGLCDEGVRWYGNTIFSVNNKYIKNEVPNIEKDKVIDALLLEQKIDVTNSTEEIMPEIIVNSTGQSDPADTTVTAPQGVDLYKENFTIDTVEAQKKASIKKYGRKKKQ